MPLRIWRRVPTSFGWTEWKPTPIDVPLKWDAPFEALEAIAARYREESPTHEYTVSVTKPKP